VFPDLDVHPDWAGVTIDDLFLHRAGPPANIAIRKLLGYHRDRRAPQQQRTEVATT
jgi:hypothetical protein